jgi:2-hydroxychromene-2-carboxylate isomerase
MTATFYYDLMSPYAYLASARIDRVLPEPATWQPILLGGLFRLTGRSSWAAYGLPQLRWPDPWPSSSLAAMRVAVHARRAGREREFAAAAFGTAFVDGRDLGELHHVLGAAEAAGLDPRAAEEAVSDRSVKDELRDQTDAAGARGVFGVPTVAVGEELFWGDDRLEEAAAAVARAGASR